jgi:DNA-binding transcriptional ArsR family regulator
MKREDGVARPEQHGLAALLGGETKRRVLHALASGPKSMSELADATEMSKESIRQALRQLQEAHVIHTSVERGQTIAAPRDEPSSRLIADLISLDHVSPEVHPVPGRLLTREELALYATQRGNLPSATITEELDESELETPLAEFVIGDPVD